MRKPTPKHASFVPPEERSKATFDRDLRAFYDGPRFLALCLGAFPTEKTNTKAKAWVRLVVKNASTTLDHLYAQYGILPSSVLNILAECKVVDSALDPTWAKIRSSRLREADAKSLEKAADLVEEWKPFVPPAVMKNPHDEDGIYPSSDQLKRIAKDIRQLGPSHPHRPREVYLTVFGQELASLFEGTTRWPLYEHVGWLLRAAFPGKWNPAGDIKEAAKKLVKKRLSGSDISHLSDYTASRTGISGLFQGHTLKTNVPMKPRKAKRLRPRRTK